jgi:hypothetical protein
MNQATTKTNNMKNQHLRLPSKTHPRLHAIIVGLALLAPAVAAWADDLLVNTFDAGISGIAWENWRSYVSGHNEVWDPAQDADGNANSGSMYVTVNWPLDSDPNWTNNWNDVQVAFSAGTFASADYIEVEAYVKVDVTNSSTAGDGSYGVMGLYVNGGSWQQVQGYATLAATDGWQRIHGSLAGIPAETYDSVVVGFISNGGSSLTNTVSYWLDNVKLTALPSVHTNQPALSIAKAPPAGLTCMATAPNDAWQRQMVRTANRSYSWHTASAASSTTTYAITVAAFPGAANSGFEAMSYLIPVTGMSSPDDGSVDWDSSHVAYFTITANADGTGKGNFRYKVNSPNAETFQSWTDFDCATGPLGTWALTFNNNTNVTMTAPDNTSKTFTIPGADADNFQGDLIAYFGVRPTDATRIGLSATFSRIKITGAAGPIDDNFVSSGPPYDLDSGTWVRKASSPQGIFITPPDAKFWVTWPQPDAGFANLFATDNLTKKLGNSEWLNLPSGDTGWLNVAGSSRLAVVKQSTLNTAFSYTPTNCFFGLFHE